MRYLSTRDAGPAPATHTFEEVLLAGLADDGGLFVPETLPKLSGAQLAGLAGRPYAELAAEIVALFAGETFAGEELSRLTGAAYGTFRHAAVAPLVQLD
ncbi:MAG: threonine synthase, partial [Alphaproteobacteria bacterium]